MKSYGAFAVDFSRINLSDSSTEDDVRREVRRVLDEAFRKVGEDIGRKSWKHSKRVAIGVDDEEAYITRTVEEYISGGQEQRKLIEDSIVEQIMTARQRAEFGDGRYGLVSPGEDEEFELVEVDGDDAEFECDFWSALQMYSMLAATPGRRRVMRRWSRICGST